MEKRIIINADDFGLCDGVNKAVVQAHRDGVVTSATIMANMPAAAEAVEKAKKLPGLGVGVHLNLTKGKPLSQEAGLAALLDKEGNFFRSVSRVLFFTLAGRKIRNAIRAELAAQIQWVIEGGIRPTHLDSHKHFHTLPHIFSMVCRLAQHFAIPAVRFTFEPKQVSTIPWPLPAAGLRKKARLFRVMARINRMQNRDFLKTDAIVGIAHFGKIDVNFFRSAALYTPAETVEVMTHPGLSDGPQAGQNGLDNHRKTELEALCSEKTKQYFKDAGIKLVHYGQL